MRSAIDCGLHVTLTPLDAQVTLSTLQARRDDLSSSIHQLTAKLAQLRAKRASESRSLEVQIKELESRRRAEELRSTKSHSSGAVVFRSAQARDWQLGARVAKLGVLNKNLEKETLAHREMVQFMKSKREELTEKCAEWANKFREQRDAKVEELEACVNILYDIPTHTYGSSPH